MVVAVEGDLVISLQFQPSSSAMECYQLFVQLLQITDEHQADVKNWAHLVIGELVQTLDGNCGKVACDKPNWSAFPAVKVDECDYVAVKGECSPV